MNLKRTLALSLVLVMILVCFAGCSKPATNDLAPGTDAATDKPATDTPAEAGNTEATGENPKVTIRLAHQSSETENLAIAYQLFKEELEAANVGFEVVIFPAGQLVGSDRDAIEAVTLGEIDMTSVAEIQFASTVPAFYLFNAGFLFESIDDAYDQFYNKPVRIHAGHRCQI